MESILYDYKPLTPTTWVYLSTLLTIAIYFKFSRLWSVRNLDLMALISLAPGLLLVDHGAADRQVVGYAWLFVTGGFFLVRLLADPSMVRRPLLEPNLSPGGLTFIGMSLLLFMTVNVLTRDVDPADLNGPRRLDQLLARKASLTPDTDLESHGPGYVLLHLLPSISTKQAASPDRLPAEAKRSLYADTARVMAIISHVAVVVGMVLIGLWHFGNARTGVAAATLYLLLPYTVQMTGRVDHVLPAALLVWAVVAYRRPLVAGMLLGLAIGAIYYPVYLLPLWIGFYWHRGLWRFLAGVGSMLAVLVSSLAFTSPDLATFWMQVKPMLGWTSFSTSLGAPNGFWSFNDAVYRIPIMAAFMVMAGGLALWPVQKNLGTLLSCSAAVMLGTQFWHKHEGGLYMAWYLPLLLLTIFRPNLEDRVAIAALDEGWLSRRRAQLQNRAA